MYTKYDQKMITYSAIELIKNAKKIEILYYHAEPFFYRPSNTLYNRSSPVNISFKMKLSFENGLSDVIVSSTSEDPDFNDIRDEILKRMIQLEEIEKNKRNNFDWSKTRLGDFLPSVREEINEELK